MDILVFYALVVWVLIFLGALISLAYGIIRRSTPYIIAGAVIVVFLCVVSSIAVAMGVKAVGFLQKYLDKMDSPEVIFTSYFGFSPTRDVTDIVATRSADFGFEYALITFTASPVTVERIVAARELVPGSFSQYPGTPLPIWWDSLTGDRVLRYGGRFENREYIRQTELLLYDGSSGRAHYLFEGSDEQP